MINIEQNKEYEKQIKTTRADRGDRLVEEILMMYEVLKEGGDE